MKELKSLRNIYVIDNHRYVPYVVITFPSFRSSSMTFHRIFGTRVTRRRNQWRRHYLPFRITWVHNPLYFLCNFFFDHCFCLLVPLCLVIVLADPRMRCSTIKFEGLVFCHLHTLYSGRKMALKNIFWFKVTVICVYR